MSHVKSKSQIKGEIPFEFIVIKAINAYKIQTRNSDLNSKYIFSAYINTVPSLARKLKQVISEGIVV